MTATTYSVLLADDEPLARRRLASLLARHPAYSVIAECEDGAEAVERIAELRPDLAFLDIHMPELDGVAVAEALAEGDPATAPAVIFVTAYDAHAVRAFDLNAVDYVLKPVDVERFDRALARASARIDARRAGGAPAQEPDAALRAVLAELRPAAAYPSRFVVRDAKGLYFVKADEVERVDAEGNYVGLWVRGRRHLLRETMKGIEGKLDPARFVRVHRSSIVNVDRVRRLEPWAHGEYVITMEDGTKITSSRTHGTRLQELLR
ncbi:LytTR family DNA-binding domain-containing protein [Roseisolibacter sp. H3M3-2]|uniref:LytR/AlgR family response regulator transcription factor n=1 Tax=Roseisolibacter sp. H3M3-2 TaxID=3031323 RepID=UPI0023DC939C|nr:LytTR family DNA-binding domain-containing protein [Roseisolibacter sp. H3M3-2]MDF1503188.1 LytTR family DNA-binding domain-containing protein [Roseisolibacter sp. H3M3-2]